MVYRIGFSPNKIERFYLETNIIWKSRKLLSTQYLIPFHLIEPKFWKIIENINLSRKTFTCFAKFFVLKRLPSTVTVAFRLA